MVHAVSKKNNRFTISKVTFAFRKCFTWLIYEIIICVVIAIVIYYAVSIISPLQIIHRV